MRGNKPRDPRQLPRTYAVVSALFQHKTGQRLCIEAIRQIERRALAKIRAAMVGDCEHEKQTRKELLCP